jgi:hypothetical protein
MRKENSSMKCARIVAVVLSLIMLCLGPAFAQQSEADKNLEQRQPLELAFADSIVPQDRHETMLTTGAWYFRRGSERSRALTQKAEFGITDRLQVAAFVNALRSSNASGSTSTGFGDFEVGARYTWARVGSPFTHLALAFDAGFPTGDPQRGLGEGAYGLAPSLLLSHEFRQGKFQSFATTGYDFVVAHRKLAPSGAVPRHQVFANTGLSVRAGPGWGVAEFSVSSNEWSGGGETRMAITPSYVWRLARRTELLFGLPVGLSSTSDRIGAVVKFTFELGGEAE